MAACSAATVPTPRLGGDFWKFWVGQSISNLGSSFTGFALPLIVYKLTGSAMKLAVTGVASTLPMLLFGLVIGAWVDRVDRRRLMIGADVCRALAIASIPLLASFQRLSIPCIYAVSFVSATLTLCFSFAQVTAIASLVTQQDLVTANGRIQASYSAVSAVGPLLAGLLVAVVPVPMLLLFDALSFGVSAGTLAWIRRSFNAAGPKPTTNIGRAIVEGLIFVWRHPIMGPIAALAALFTLVIAPLGAQTVLFAKERLLASDLQVGLIYSAQSVGVVLLSLVAGRLRRRWSFSRMILGSLTLSGLLTVVLALTPWFWAAASLFALRAGLVMLFNINVISLRQVIVPNAMLGRVSSTLNVIASSAAPLGIMLAGLAIDRTHDVALVYGIAGLLAALIALAFALTPLAHAERYVPQAAAQS